MLEKNNRCHVAAIFFIAVGGECSVCHTYCFCLSTSFLIDHSFSLSPLLTHTTTFVLFLANFTFLGVLGYS